MLQALLIRGQFRLLALSIAACLCAPLAEAQTKPFKVSGAGIADFIPVVPYVPAFHFAVGKGTNLGQYYGEGMYRLEAFTGPTTGIFSSEVPFVFTGANGDRLAFHYGRTDFGASGPGQVSISPAPNGTFNAVWVAEFTPVPAECTGQFAKVIGGKVVMKAISQPFVLGSFDPVQYSWSGSGNLIYKK